MSYWFILSLIIILSDLAPESAPPLNLILQLRDGTSEERSDAKRELLLEDAKPLGTDAQRELVQIFIRRDLPNDVRTDAMSILFEKSTTLSDFREELSNVLASRSEAPEIRANALIGLQLILRRSPQSPEITDRLFRQLADRSESTEFRYGAGGALNGVPACHEKLIDSLTKMVASRDEGFDSRSHMMRVIEFTVPFNPKKTEQVTSCLVRLASDDTESVHLRVEALSSLATVLLHSKYNSAEVQQATEALSLKLIKLLRNTQLHRSIRERAGTTLSCCHKVHTSLVDELIAVLVSDERFLHEPVAQTLGRIGSPAKSSVPHLIKVRDDMDASKNARTAAEEALLEIDPETAGRLGIRERIIPRP